MRLLAILTGVLPVFAVGLVCCWWDRGSPAGVRPITGSVPVTDTVSADESRSAGPTSIESPAWTEHEMMLACRQRATWAAGQLGPSCSVLIRAPFVMGGDLSERQLERCYQETIRPAADALTTSYLAARPDRPITVLLFAGQESYREAMRGLFGEKNPPHFGSYRSHLRVLALDFSTGCGTIVHELTHALVRGDFPGIPDWFNEGLASLHEKCRMAGDDGAGSGRRLEGLVNWRLPILQTAIRQQRLRPLQSLISSDDFHGSQERLNYAQARYFCLYLQRRSVLGPYYGRLRADVGGDPTGLATLLKLFPGRSVDQLDADFRHWAMQLKPVSRGTSSPDLNREERGDAE